MESTTEMELVAPQDNPALYLITKAEIDTQISTAKAYPRSMGIFLKKAESMAIITQDVASSCNYSVSRAGKKIEGPSVRLAEIICAAYGNLRYGSRVVMNDGKTITAQGICHDLENNICATVEVKRRITDKKGQTFSDDMQVVTGNAACAIAFRNAVYKVVPAALISDIYDKTIEVARGTVETLIPRRDKAISLFKSWGVTEKQILDALGVKTIEDITLDELHTLSGMKSAIKNGEMTVKEMFEPADSTINLEDLQMLYDLKKEVLTVEEATNATRILENKEVASYSKLQKILQAK
jgi:hypothetical protein